MGWEGFEYINMVQVRDKWRAVVNAVMAFRFDKIGGISWLAEKLIASNGGLCSVELFTYLWNYAVCNEMWKKRERHFFALVKAYKLENDEVDVGLGFARCVEVAVPIPYVGTHVRGAFKF